MKNIKHVLVPIDFSSHARQAALTAIWFARLARARVTFLHVVDSRYADAMFAGYLENRAGRYQEVMDAAGRQLADFVKSLDTEGLTTAQIVQDGIPSERILAAEGDMVVMGSRGRTGVDRLLCGSETEDVIREASRPTLVVHAPIAG